MPGSQCRRPTIRKHCRALLAPRITAFIPRATPSSSTARAACGFPTGCRISPNTWMTSRLLRSCQADGVNHVGAVCQMNTGEILAGRPSMGAWVTYGLGSANQNLPTFVVMQDDKEILGGVQNYSSGFLPATYQGTLFRKGDTPILNLKPPTGMTDAQERNKLEFLQAINDRFGRDKQDDTELDARTRSYELAYRMQSSAPEAVDLSSESEATKKLYGWTIRLPRCMERTCCSRAAWSSAAFDSWNATTARARAGTRIAVWKRITRKIASRATSRSPVAGRFESSRHVEGHAGGVGRGIRPHAFRARQSRMMRRPGAITIRGASPSGWRAAA
jgi:hypothetical protein